MDGALPPPDAAGDDAQAGGAVPGADGLAAGGQPAVAQAAGGQLALEQAAGGQPAVGQAAGGQLALEQAAGGQPAAGLGADAFSAERAVGAVGGLATRASPRLPSPAASDAAVRMNDVEVGLLEVAADVSALQAQVEKTPEVVVNLLRESGLFGAAVPRVLAAQPVGALASAGADLGALESSMQDYLPTGGLGASAGGTVGSRALARILARATERPTSLTPAALFCPLDVESVFVPDTTRSQFSPGGLLSKPQTLTTGLGSPLLLAWRNTLVWSQWEKRNTSPPRRLELVRAMQSAVHLSAVSAALERAAAALPHLAAEVNFAAARSHLQALAALAGLDATTMRNELLAGSPGGLEPEAARAVAAVRAAAFSDGPSTGDPLGDELARQLRIQAAVNLGLQSVTALARPPSASASDAPKPASSKVPAPRSPAHTPRQQQQHGSQQAPAQPRAQPKSSPQARTAGGAAPQSNSGHAPSDG
jgi:hypothetical protein